MTTDTLTREDTQETLSLRDISRALGETGAWTPDVHSLVGPAPGTDTGTPIFDDVAAHYPLMDDDWWRARFDHIDLHLRETIETQHMAEFAASIAAAGVDPAKAAGGELQPEGAYTIDVMDDEPPPPRVAGAVYHESTGWSDPVPPSRHEPDSEQRTRAWRMPDDTAPLVRETWERPRARPGKSRTQSAVPEAASRKTWELRARSRTQSAVSDDTVTLPARETWGWQRARSGDDDTAPLVRETWWRPRMRPGDGDYLRGTREVWWRPARESWWRRFTSWLIGRVV